MGEMGDAGMIVLEIHISLSEDEREWDFGQE
jgi:hypothetical protein